VHKKYTFTIIALALVLGVVFFGDAFVQVEGSSALTFRKIVRASFAWIGAVVSSPTTEENISTLMQENASLKAKLFFLEHDTVRIIAEQRIFVSAPVYSTYPFNNRSLITIAAGKADKIVAQAPVVFGDYIFLGEVFDVTEQTSIVRTVFDPGWELPVKIGEDSVDALLIGGRTPRLTLIVSSAKLNPGDTIFTATPTFPYGLTIGEVDEISYTPGSGFQEAHIRLPYEFSMIDTVSVILP